MFISKLVQRSAALAILTTDFGPDTSGDSTEVHGFSMQMKTGESVLTSRFVRVILTLSRVQKILHSSLVS